MRHRWYRVGLTTKQGHVKGRGWRRQHSLYRCVCGVSCESMMLPQLGLTQDCVVAMNRFAATTEMRGREIVHNPLMVVTGELYGGRRNPRYGWHSVKIDVLFAAADYCDTRRRHFAAIQNHRGRNGAKFYGRWCELVRAEIERRSP